MGEFFRGWRRIVGVVTLVIAGAFSDGMVRTAKIHDRLLAKIGEHHYRLLSRDGFLRLTQYKCKDPAPLRNWESRPANAGGDTAVVDTAPINWKWHWECCGFELGNGIFRSGTILINAIRIPYWPAIPLALLLAYLLLAKTRSSKPAMLNPTILKNKD